MDRASTQWSHQGAKRVRGGDKVQHLSPGASVGILSPLGRSVPPKQLAKYITLKMPGTGILSVMALVYISRCQEHFSPSAGGASLVRDIQPLTMEDARVVSCPWVVPSQQLHLREQRRRQSVSKLNQAVRLYGVNHGSI
jgi:hypothetical protein